jgi:uncharacterized protein YbjT (DUF2867 family)
MQTRKIAVAGATGRVGGHVVDVLEAAGHDVVRISRRPCSCRAAQAVAARLETLTAEARSH